MAVLGIVDRAGRCAQYVDSAGVEAGGEVVGYLAAHREDGAVGLLQVDDVHHALKGELVEVEAVAGVVVGRHGLGIVVDHHRAPALFLDGHQGIDRAPVKLHRRADAVCARAEHYHRAVVVEVVDIVLGAVVGEVEIVGHGRILGCQGVYLLYHRHYAEGLAALAHGKHTGLAVGHGVFYHRAGYLEIAEALLLGQAHKLGRYGVDTVVALKLGGGGDDIVQLEEKPAVYLCELVYSVDIHAGLHGGGDGKDTLVGGVGQGALEVVDLEVAVFDKAVHPLPYHAQTLLESLLKGAADGHHLAHRFHRRADLALYAVEFTEVPARYLHHHIVQRRLKEGRCGAGDGVFEVK